jgi:hypothetical protein
LADAAVNLLGRLVRRLGTGVDGARDLYWARRLRASAATRGEDFGVASGNELNGVNFWLIGVGVVGNWRDMIKVYLFIYFIYGVLDYCFLTVT